jgi:hypothetical protein
VWFHLESAGLVSGCQRECERHAPGRAWH